MTTPVREYADYIEVPDSASETLPEAAAGDCPGPARVADAARRAKSGSSWRVLGQRYFRLYFSGSLISNLGTWLQSTAQVVIAYQVTRSVFIVGLIASAQFAGMVASPWAPVLAARFSARAVLVGTQGFSALIAVLMACLHLANMLRVGWLLVGALGLGFAFALALPVQTALIPALVPDADVGDAVKMNSVSYNAGRALAPAVCVPVIIFIGPDLIFALNAISFVIFVAILRKLPLIADEVSFRDTFARALRTIRLGSILPVPRATLDRAADPASHSSATPQRARVRDGLITALQRRRLLLLMAIVAAVTLGDDPITVLSPAVAARLHMPSASAGYFIAALGWGSVLGSLMPIPVKKGSARYASRRASRRAATSLLILGVSIIAFTASYSFIACFAAVILAGSAGLFTGAAAQTALLRHQQENTADVTTVASVAALWAIAWAGTKPFASLLDGWLASHVGILATGVALTSPAIGIALCELLLPHPTKDRINLYSERTALRIIELLERSSSADPEPRQDEIEQTDISFDLGCADEGGCVPLLTG